MPLTQPISTLEPTPHLLTREPAAAHLGFKLEAFDLWLRHGLVAKNPARKWTITELDEALERARRGLQHDNPTRRHSHFIKIPRCQRIWRKLQQGDGAGHWLFYFRPTGEPLPGAWGSPEFTAALIAAERRWAGQQLAAQPSAPGAGGSNQAGDMAQSRPFTPSNAPEFVTRKVVQAADRPRTPAELASKMRRRRAAITQAEIARIIRAARQAGASQLELRLTDSAVIVIRLEVDNPLASDEEIVL